MHDLLLESENGLSKVRMGSSDSYVDLVQEKVDNPLDFSKVIKKALLSRSGDKTKINVSHLYVFDFLTCFLIVCFSSLSLEFYWHTKIPLTHPESQTYDKNYKLSLRFIIALIHLESHVCL